MSTLSPDAALLSRRGVLKIGFFGAAFLSTVGLTASLSGCSASHPAAGFMALRANDLPFLRALLPVMLSGAHAQADSLPSAVDGSLKALDASLAHLSPEMLKLTQQLFDVLALPVTRGPLTGIWGSWEHASSADIQSFLARWQNSSLSLLRMGHASLLQLVMMACYTRPESWAVCGYPGPPTV